MSGFKRRNEAVQLGTYAAHGKKTDVSANNGTGSVHQIGGRQGECASEGVGNTHRVYEYGVGDLEIVHEINHFLVCVGIHGNSEDLERSVGPFLVEPDQFRCLYDTWTTPGSPEIDQGNPAFQQALVNGFASYSLRRKRRQILAQVSDRRAIDRFRSRRRSGSVILEPYPAARPLVAPVARAGGDKECRQQHNRAKAPTGEVISVRFSHNGCHGERAGGSMRGPAFRSVTQKLQRFMSTDRPTGAEHITWDLTDLYATDEDALRALEKASGRAGEFADAHRGKLADVGAAAFADLLKTYAGIQDAAGRAYTYAYLAWSTNTASPATGKLLQAVKEEYTALSTKLLFFELEWVDLDDERADEYLQLAETRDIADHYLRMLRLNKPHVLSEPEERILVEKGLTGRSAWNRYFDETMGAMRFTLHGEQLTQQQVLARLHEKDRSLRRDAAEAFSEGLRENERTLTFIFNTLLSDKSTDDRLRGFTSWIQSRNLANEVDGKDVEALINTVTGSYDVVGRFYRLKKDLLGIDEMTEYDRYAPVSEADSHWTWDRARDIVTRSYAEFSPEIGRIVERFFDEKWIDAALGDAKRGGAFSHGAVPSAHPYILLNYTGQVRDVQTLAHELGHGVHQYLSRGQGIFHADTPLTTAETASVFGEMLVFQNMLAAETDPMNRLSMLMGKIDDTMATVFRQVTMNRFENRIHTLRREEGELDAEQFCSAWMETQEAMFQGSVTLGENYRHWWSYIPHFLHTPGYVYAYAFGELLVLALYRRYLDAPDAFVREYTSLLSAGGSDWPHVLVGRLGIDLRDPAFWQSGIDAINDLVQEAETLAASHKKS